MAGRMFALISNVDMRHMGGTKYYQICSIANPDTQTFMLITMWGSLKGDDIGTRNSKTYTYQSLQYLTDAAQVKMLQKSKKEYEVTSKLGQNWLEGILKVAGCPIRNMTDLPLSADAAPAKQPAMSEWDMRRAVIAIRKHLGNELHDKVVNHFRAASGIAHIATDEHDVETIQRLAKEKEEAKRLITAKKEAAYGDTWGAW